MQSALSASSLLSPSAAATSESAQPRQERIESNPATDPASRRVFWRFYASVYDLVWDSPVTRALTAEADNHVPRTGTLVDLGCGTGLMTRGRSQHRIGVDSSASMLKRAQRKGRIDAAILGNAQATGLPNDHASVVLVCNLLHLHADPRALIDEAVRICGPTGRIFLCWPLDEPNTDSLLVVDLMMGRPALKALLANELRRAISFAAALSTTPRFACAGIEQAISETTGVAIVLNTVVRDCQRVVILTPQSSKTAGKATTG